MQEQLVSNGFEIPSELASLPCTYTLTPEKAVPNISRSSPQIPSKTGSFVSTPSSTTSKPLGVLPTKVNNSSSKIRGDRVRGSGNRVTSQSVSYDLIGCECFMMVFVFSIGPGATSIEESISQ